MNIRGTKYIRNCTQHCAIAKVYTKKCRAKKKAQKQQQKERKEQQLELLAAEQQRAAIRISVVTDIVDQTRVIAERDEAIAQRDRVITQRDRVITQRDELVMQCDYLTDENKSVVRERNELIRSRNTTIVERDQAIVDRDKELQAHARRKRKRDVEVDDANKRVHMLSIEHDTVTTSLTESHKLEKSSLVTSHGIETAALRAVAKHKDEIVTALRGRSTSLYRDRYRPKKYTRMHRGSIHTRRGHKTITVPCFVCRKTIDSQTCDIGSLDGSHANFFCGQCNEDVDIHPSTRASNERIGRWRAFFGDSVYGKCLQGNCDRVLFAFDAWHWCHTVAQAEGGDATLENGTIGCATCNVATGVSNSVTAGVERM
jgi:hypothetical protein